MLTRPETPEDAHGKIRDLPLTSRDDLLDEQQTNDALKEIFSRPAQTVTDLQRGLNLTFDKNTLDAVRLLEDRSARSTHHAAAEIRLFAVEGVGG